MLRNFYYFEGTTKSLDKLKVEIGKNLISYGFSLIGKSLNLSVEDEHLVMYFQGEPIARTGRVVSVDALICEPEQMPFCRETRGGKCSSQEMVVYTTESGSMYAFIPSYANLYEV